jgi:hypothetical protein
LARLWQFLENLQGFRTQAYYRYTGLNVVGYTIDYASATNMTRQSLSTAYGTALVFCFLFAFRLPLVYNSAMFACMVATLHLAFQPAKYRLVVALLLNKYFITLNGIVISFFIYATASTVAHGEYDFSFLSLIASYLVYAFSSPVIFASVNASKDADVENYIINAFFVQSFIILLAFLIPSVRDALRIFKDESQLEIADSYFGGGLRGLALAGGLFFSLSCGYCLYFILIARRFVEKKCSYFFLGAVLVSMFSAVTAGRTALIGMGVAAALVMFQKMLLPDARVAKANIKRLFGVIFAILLTVLLTVPQKYLDTAFESYMRFSFEMVFNVLEGKGLTTSSTDQLRQMYFPLEFSELVGGDGRYSGVGGGYFKQTDAGYMRNVLLAGLPVVGIALMHLAAWLFAMKRYAGRQKGSRLVKHMFLLGLAFMVLLLHYKGEAMLYVVMINNILYLLFFGWAAKQGCVVQKGQSHKTLYYESNVKTT